MAVLSIGCTSPIKNSASTAHKFHFVGGKWSQTLKIFGGAPMSKYFKGRFLFSKVVVTIIILDFITLTQYGVISNMLNGLFMVITLVVFFVVDSNLRKNKEYN